MDQMDPSRGPVTRYVVAMTAVAALLAVVGVQVQRAAIAPAPSSPEPLAAASAPPPPPSSLVLARIFGLCEGERLAREPSAVPEEPAPPVAAAVSAGEPDKAAGAPWGEYLFVALLSPENEVRRAWLVDGPPVSPVATRDAVQAALLQWRVPRGALPEDGRAPGWRCVVVRPALEVR